MYALPTSDGAAVMVEVPRACGGATTENGLVPEDFLPATVTYDSKDDLSVGKLYASDDAYDGPLSKLEFKGATIEAASEEEFRAFITGDGFKKNLITLKSSTDLRGTESRVYFTDELKEHPERVWKQRMPSFCMGAMRLKVPEELREYVRTLWKPGGPRYWFVSREHSGEMITWLGGIKASTGRKRPFPRIYFDGKSFNDYDIPFDAWGGGMLRRDGSGPIGGFNKIQNEPRNFAPEYYPMWNSTSAVRVQAMGKNPEFKRYEIETGSGEKKGFHYCEARLEGEEPFVHFLGEFGRFRHSPRRQAQLFWPTRQVVRRWRRGDFTSGRNAWSNAGLFVFRK